MQDRALYIRLDDLPPGLIITPDRLLALMRPADEYGWPAAMEAWQRVFAHWQERKRKGLS
jgi:hypothetical protein